MDRVVLDTNCLLISLSKRGFALTLKERGIPIKEIATASGLSEEEINSL